MPAPHPRRREKWVKHGDGCGIGVAVGVAHLCGSETVLWGADQAVDEVLDRLGDKVGEEEVEVRAQGIGDLKQF